jgi:hypothetical protein
LILNYKTFQYVIDTKCDYSIKYFENNNRNVQIIWIITSFAGDISKRSTLRQAYTINPLKQLGIKMIF